MSKRHAWCKAATAGMIALGSASATAADFASVLDEFWIKLGAAGASVVEIFRDTFGDGVLPPSGPDGANTYGVFGANGMTSEADGKLTMTPFLGDPVVLTTTFADLSTSGVRRLATNPANPAFLGQASAFELHALYDLSSLPTIAGQSLGLRASDRVPDLGNEGNNGYQIFLGVSPANGDRLVVLRKHDFTTDTSVVVDSLSIESLLPNADQIEFIFTKAAGADTLGASFQLFDYQAADPLLASGALGANTALTIYDGEPYIRGQFEVTDRVPAIPEPSTWALLLAGLAVVAWRRRRART